LLDNGRDNAKKVIIFTFDGCPGFSASAYCEELKEDGFVIADIGIDYVFTSSFYQNILTKAATNPNLALFAPNFDGLDPLELSAYLQVEAYDCSGTTFSTSFRRDGALSIDNIEVEGDCNYPSYVEVTFIVEAFLELAIPSGTEVSFYHNDPSMYASTYISSFTIPCSIEPGTSETFTTIVPVEVATHLYAVLNDDGQSTPGFSLPVTDIPEEVYSNNIDDELICVDSGVPVLQALMSSTTLTPICDGLIEYTIAVCNLSDVNAEDVNLYNDVPSGFVLVDAYISDSECFDSIEEILYFQESFDLPANCCAVVRYTYDVSGAPDGYYGDQDVTLYGPADYVLLDFDGATTTNEDVLLDGTEDCGSTNVTFDKAVSVGTTCEDHMITYSFTIDNQTSSAISGIQFTDILPEPLVWVYKPYELENISITSEFLSGQSAEFTIDNIAAETVGSFDIDVVACSVIRHKLMSSQIEQ